MRFPGCSSAALAVLIHLLVPARTSVAATFPPVTAQQVAVPSYFYPGSIWNRLRQGAPTVGLVIINPNSGPGSQVDEFYVSEVSLSKRRGVVVLGYVPTGYGTRSKAAVQADIARYQKWYAVDGFFLDEAAASCAQKNHYQALYLGIKKQNPQATVVINPGDVTPECYASTADIIVNFEGNYTTYQKWQPAGWEGKYPSNRFWHLIHNTPPAGLAKAIELSRQRHAGWIYVTPDRMPNPWDTLPSNTYWQQEIQQVGR